MPQLVIFPAMAHQNAALLIVCSLFSFQCIAANAGRSLASAAVDITPTAEMELETINNNSHSSVPAIAPATAPFEQKAALQDDRAVVPLGPDGSTTAIVTGNDILTQSNEVIVRLNRPRQVNSISALPTQDQNPDVPVTLAAAAAAAAPPAQGMDRMFNRIFNLHNQYRALHKAQPLTWSSSLASQAAQHAARCSLAHDRGSGAADNLFAISDTHSPAGYLVAAIDMW
jgi:hypothetical protein